MAVGIGHCRELQSRRIIGISRCRTVWGNQPRDITMGLILVFPYISPAVCLTGSTWYELPLNLKSRGGLIDCPVRRIRKNYNCRSSLIFAPYRFAVLIKIRKE